MSTTAISITGDITVGDDQITFQNGASLPLRPAGAPGVYALESGANPTLLNGNTLCGEEPPTFIVLGRPDENTLYLKVFDTDQAPEASDAVIQRGICASFNYVR